LQVRSVNAQQVAKIYHNCNNIFDNGKANAINVAIVTFVWYLRKHENKDMTTFNCGRCQSVEGESYHALFQGCLACSKMPQLQQDFCEKNVVAFMVFLHDLSHFATFAYDTSQALVFDKRTWPTLPISIKSAHKGDA
jgi:hypothetical protein